MGYHNVCVCGCVLLRYGSFLTNREFFLARVAIVLALRGFQALGSVKRLETIVLLWRHINKIELN